MTSGTIDDGSMYYNPRTEIWWRYDLATDRWIPSWHEESIE